VSPIRIALLTTLLLQPAARVWAAPQYDYAGQPNELYHAEVCNQGQIKVLVAVAYKDFGFTDEFWMIDYWYRVDPGKCKLVFSQFYAPNNLFSFQSFPLHLAFVFTDSTGVTGAVKVRPPRGVAASRFNLCLGAENYKYRVNGKTPETKCKAGLVPASIDWEPTQGVYPNSYSRQYPPPKRFTVALGPNDRAIPVVGWHASPGATAAGPGDKMDLHAVLKDLMRGADAPRPRISGEYGLSVCVDPTVVKRQSWANPPTARTKAFRETVRQFLVSHSFSNVHGYLVYIKVTEIDNKFIAEEVKACSGDYEFGLWSSASDKQRSTAPSPAVKQAPQPKAKPEPSPGFGDLIGPGGFITPLPEKK
jgi:hypothetical protein